MKIWETVNNLFRRGGDVVANLTSSNLDSILDHPKINLDENEVKRVRENFRFYAGKHDKVKFRNTNGKNVEREFMGLNMTKEAASYIASLVFNEQCEIVVSRTINDNGVNQLQDANEFIQHVFNHNKFKKNFSQYLEAMFATGGLAVRPYVDKGEVEFAWCLADTFYPLRNNTNNISECAIANVTIRIENKKPIYYTLLEFHEWENDKYRITNELYRSERKEKLGHQVPINTIYENLQPVSYIRGLSRPLFGYLKPFGFNNINPRSALGLGIVDNARPTLERINVTSDEFYWEIKKGKRRRIVSDHFIQTQVNEQGVRMQYFDDDEDTFLALPGGLGDMVNSDITPDIRSDKYIESINHFFGILEMQIKMSAGTFTFDGQGVKTATEVVSEDSLTYRTRNSHITMIEEFIKELIISVFELASKTIMQDRKALYQGEIPEWDDIGLNFDDGIFTNKNAELDYWSKALSSGIVSKKHAIQKILNLPEKEAQRMLDEINQERPDVSLVDKELYHE